MRRLLPLALFLPAVAFAGWPIGQQIAPALFADLTKDGLDELSSLLPALVPPSIAVPDVHQSGSINLWVYTEYYGADATGMVANVVVDDAQITPGTGVLNLHADLTVGLNDAGSPANVDAYDTILGTLSCPTYVTPFNVTLDTTIALSVVDDGVNPPHLVADVGAIAWNWDLAGTDVQMDCWLGDVNNFFGFLGYTPFDLIISALQPTLDTQIQNLRPTLASAIESAFSAASISQDVALGQSTMHVDVHPTDVTIVPAGVRVAAAGSFTSEQAPCIAEYHQTESQETDSTPPDIALAPASISTPYHIGALLDDDFVNAGLFAAYNAGVLCYQVDDTTGLPIDTTILTILDKNAFAPMFPTSEAMVVQTRPAETPVASPVGDHAINVAVHKLGVDFMADTDYRMANLVGVDLDVATGADLNFDGTTGTLAVAVPLTGKDITPTIRLNEFAPGDDAVITSSFSGLFDSLVGPLLAKTLGGLSFPLPSFSGAGVTQLQSAASGPQNDWFGLYANLGPVTYDNSGGCSGSGSGCGGGCGTGGRLPANGVVMLLPLIAGIIRRRR